MAADNDSRFYVYVHRRKTDNTVFYVGKGCGTRIYKTVDRSIFWQNIVNKNGVIKEFVLKNLTEPQAIDLEVQLIAHYGRYNLCNLTDGGDGMAGHAKSLSAIEAVRKTHTGRKRSPETCKRISQSQLGKVFSQDTRKKISQKLKGQIVSDETKQKMASSRTGKKYSDEWRSNMSKAWKTTPELYKARCEAMVKEGKKVICLDTGVIYDKIKIAVQWIKTLNLSKNPSHSKIVMCCRGKRNTAYGYRWQYVNE
jgi:hypothetical protein